MADSQKKARPVVPVSNEPDLHLPIELFQNEVLRPILKVQHDILLAAFHHVRKSFSDDWEELKKSKKTKMVQALMLKNGPLKNTIIGIVIGQLEMEEMDTYLKDKKEYDRRITGMSMQRIQSTF